jgi:hypothetical protein
MELELFEHRQHTFELLMSDENYLYSQTGIKIERFYVNEKLVKKRKSKG